MSLTIRPAVTADIEICGRIIYQAFKDIADRHRFPPDFPAVQDGIQLATSFILARAARRRWLCQPRRRAIVAMSHEKAKVTRGHEQGTST